MEPGLKVHFKVALSSMQTELAWLIHLRMHIIRLAAMLYLTFISQMSDQIKVFRAGIIPK